MSTFRCPRCNHELPANARFCNRCGFTPADMPSLPASGKVASPDAMKTMAPGTNPSLSPFQQRPAVGTQSAGGPSPAPGTVPAQPPLPPVRQLATGLPPLRTTPAMPGNQGMPAPAGNIQPIRISTPPSVQVWAGQARQAPALPPLTTRMQSPVAVPPTPQQVAVAHQGSITALMPEVGPESLAATSKAAEHWRSSWLERQRAEAGPAYGITRGQALVDEPLQVMQNSFIRMRTLIPPKNAEKQRSKVSFGFWITIIMMICLVGGLSAYIIYTYLPGTLLQTQINVASSAPAPMLTLAGNAGPSITVGKSFKIHGSYFGANDAITFILNMPLTDSNGKPLSVQSSSNGDFTTEITIPASMPAGAYALEAQDNHTGQHAFLDTQILSPTAQSTTDTVRATTADGTSSLKFTALTDKGNPQAQTITLKNVSDNQVRWTADAVTTNGINWILIENDTTGSLLDGNGSATVEIGVQTTNLQTGTYTGQVVFTIQEQGQVVVPVTLSIGSTATELVVAPDPVMASWQAGGTCQPTSLTLLDMSNTPISWEVKENDALTSQNIRLDGKTDLTGNLDPNGPAGNIAILQITCSSANLNESYQVTVYYNNRSQVIPIIIGN